MFKPKKILVPTDFSDHSAKALERALDIAKQNNSELIMLHVIQQDVQSCTVDYCFSEDEMERLEKNMLEGAKDLLHKELARFPLAREVKISTEVLQGVPYEEILKFQVQNSVDLIVIASHGRSGITKYFLGSVSSNVLKGAKCEVLLVK
jgi:nucleotide-binding universal stress UspA family protein